MRDNFECVCGILYITINRPPSPVKRGLGALKTMSYIKLNRPRGGAREGSGRKKLPPELKKKQNPLYCMRITPAAAEAFDAEAKRLGLSRTAFFEQLAKKYQHIA